MRGSMTAAHGMSTLSSPILALTRYQILDGNKRYAILLPVLSYRRHDPPTPYQLWSVSVPPPTPSTPFPASIPTPKVKINGSIEDGTWSPRPRPHAAARDQTLDG